MRAGVSTLRVPKAGSRADECEDACAVRLDARLDDGAVCGYVAAAIADGASESLLARDWARLLVHTAVDAVADDGGHAVRDGWAFSALADCAGRRWDSWLAAYVAGREARGRPLKWYERPGLDRGAHATLTVLHIAADGPAASWRAAALGDSCVFQVRDDELLCAFPEAGAAAFGITPALLGSRARDRRRVAARTRLAHGTCLAGDDFYLATDALAAWFLGEAERGGRPWKALDDFSDRADSPGFAAWVAGLRAEGCMRDDDVVLVHVGLG